MVYTVPHFMGGKKNLQESGPSQAIYNPAWGEPIGQVFFGDKTLCDTVVQQAKTAWYSWSTVPPLKRAHILFQFRDLLEKYQLDLAKLVTREHGKTIEDAKGSVLRAIEVVEYHCGLMTQLQGNFSANVATQVDCYTLRQSLGVCAGVSPFNFPVMVPVWMMIPAIACGNTFILKPSEQDPSPPIRLMELLTEAGIPEGVVNCIQGDKNTVDILLRHPDIAAFTAVASTPVAQKIYTTAIANHKRAHTFGGAKNHCVVLPDADLDYTASAIVSAAFGSAGERCMALSVAVVVGETTAEQLTEQLVNRASKIQIDCGDEAGCEMGPLISEAHRQRVIRAIDEGVKEGARLRLDGRAFVHAKYSKGFFVGPTLFDQVTATMTIYQQEIFGPVLVVLNVESLEEAIALVNRHQYGNGTAIFTRDGFSARKYVEQVQVGMVGINIPIPVPIASHPFGGWKQSVFGDTNMHGLESIRFYTKLKTVTCKWPESLAQHSFAMPSNR